MNEWINQSISAHRNPLLIKNESFRKLKGLVILDSILSVSSEFCEWVFQKSGFWHRPWGMGISTCSTQLCKFKAHFFVNWHFESNGTQGFWIQSFLPFQNSVNGCFENWVFEGRPQIVATKGVQYLSYLISDHVIMSAKAKNTNVMGTVAAKYPSQSKVSFPFMEQGPNIPTVSEKAAG